MRWGDFMRPSRGSCKDCVRMRSTGYSRYALLLAGFNERIRRSWMTGNLNGMTSWARPC